MNHKETLRLPRSTFPLQAQQAQQEAAILARWREQKLYEQRQEALADAPRLSLHDGPPYTYHEPAIRDVFTKILKDIWVRASHMMGRRCDFVPGWDCHGLPVSVEVKARLEGQGEELSALAFRAACRSYVEESIALQRDLFERMGVLAAWEQAYQTMSPAYEAALMRGLASMVRADALAWRHQPVNWCGSCATALAPFELRYKEVSSPSMYIGYPLISDPMTLDRTLRGRDVEMVVWTRAPWQLPGNMALGIQRDANYVAVRVHRRVYIVAEDSLEATAAACRWGNDNEASVTLTGEQLLGHRCRHPLLHRELPLLGSSRVQAGVGSGCVQISPGHNLNDYELAKEHGLELYCPIDEHGCFSPQATAWAGQHFSEVGARIQRQLQEWGALLSNTKQEIKHHAPHCRRCEQPTCQRAAPLWFLSMTKGDLRTHATEAAAQVDWQPPWMGQQMQFQLAGRLDWCLSRQRRWGVPLPMFYCKRCERPWVDADMIESLATMIEAHPHGSDAWYERSAEELLDETGHSPRCPRCFLKEFRKETDVLDVWFEAGASFLAQAPDITIDEDGKGDDESHQSDGACAPAAPFDLYLESTEQIQSWFQSALLASVSLHQQAPFLQVRGHARVARPSSDEAAAQAPAALLAEYGADVVRLWVALNANQEQRTVAPVQLGQYRDQLQKLRGMCRFLLGNLDGFTLDMLVSRDDLQPLEQVGMQELEQLVVTTREAFEAGTFGRAWQALMSFVGRDLSRFACEVLKERLYCEAAAAPVRRSAQSYVYHCLSTLAQLCAPVCAFLAEEIWTLLPTHGNHSHPVAGDEASGRPWSVHLTILPESPDAATIGDVPAISWSQLRELRALARAALPTDTGAAMGLEVSCDSDGLLAALESWPEEGLGEILGAAFLVFSQHEAESAAETRGQRGPRLLRQQVKLTWTALDDVRCPRCRRLAGQANHPASYCTRCHDATTTDSEDAVSAVS